VKWLPWLGRVAQIVIATIISTGLITVYLQHNFDKKLRTHELKVERYLALIDALSNWAAYGPASRDLPVQINAALCYSSDEVAVALLDLGQEMNGSAREIPATAFKPLVLAIRRDLYLSSAGLEERDLHFFTLPQSAWAPDTTQGNRQ
jgi:hypothetical protein